MEGGLVFVDCVSGVGGWQRQVWEDPLWQSDLANRSTGTSAPWLDMPGRVRGRKKGHNYPRPAHRGPLASRDFTSRLEEDCADGATVSAEEAVSGCAKPSAANRDAS